MLVSHSQLAVFRRCPREYFFRYRLGRYPKGSAQTLITGKSVHSAIGAHLRGEPWTLEDPVQRAMLHGYIARWRDAGWTIERTDIPFVFSIGNVGGEPVEVNGEIDAVGHETHRIDERAIFEHKTTSEDITPGSSYWRRVLQVDAQVSTYLRAGSTMGYKQVIYDVLRKPQLRQKRDESPDEFYARVLGDIAERPEYYYQRAVVVRMEDERGDFVRDVLGTVRLIMVGEFPRNVDSCMKWNRPCEYFGVCTGEIEITDENRFQGRDRRTAPDSVKQPASSDVASVAGDASPYKW